MPAAYAGRDAANLLQFSDLRIDLAPDPEPSGPRPHRG